VTANGLALVAPGAGRRFAATRRVRLGDVLPTGDARLDAIARYLQDVAADDGHDAGIDRHLVWLVRKTILDLRRRPRVGEQVDLVTWASGSGARWAERRTTISVRGEPLIEAACLWVCVDGDTMRPARLSERFWAMYGEAVGDRTVSSRLTHPDPPTDGAVASRPWPVRMADLDLMGHMNNAATWVPVEEELERFGGGRPVVTAEVEYRGPIDRSHDTAVVSRVEDGVLRLWLVDEAIVRASAAVTLG
jgi:acyl-ACP thioesterase